MRANTDASGIYLPPWFIPASRDPGFDKHNMQWTANGLIGATSSCDSCSQLEGFYTTRDRNSGDVYTGLAGGYRLRVDACCWNCGKSSSINFELSLIDQDSVYRDERGGVKVIEMDGPNETRIARRPGLMPRKIKRVHLK